ncbi:peptidase [Streptomyces albofaciens JCM 4342]|uniref:SPFH domain-containing protein n=1 Tax=Streptomyces albofaciens TaxID=66866 RepID=UPI0012395D2B|nr:SPFH domain-containing protein [Streptomyces albofaciens]KAA6221682.1 peptidase [Streptomyces albofaciens JCM 4342]
MKRRTTAQPSLWTARARSARYGDGIPMDMLFRAEPEAEPGAETGKPGEAKESKAAKGAEAPDDAKAPDGTDGPAAAHAPAAVASDGPEDPDDVDTAEQPPVRAPLAAPASARVTPADAAVAGITAATGLLDTAERAALDGALGVVDAGSRFRTDGAPGTGGDRKADSGTAPGRPAWFREFSGTAERRAPEEDPGVAERRGFSLSGWLAVFVGLLAIAASVAFLWWRGLLPASVVRALGLDIAISPAPRPWEWAVAGLGGVLALCAFGGLARGRVGSAWVLSLFGRYRGSVRRTGLVWISPLVLRRRVDVRLRHWRSEAMPAVDAQGIQLRVVVLVVWRVRDTARALLAVRDHTAYLREQVEAAMARVLSQLPADAFHEETPTLRNAEAVGEALTRALAADCRPVGIEVFSVQPTRIEYAPEVAAAMQRRQIAAIDAKHRDSVLTSVVDAVDDTVHRLTSRGLVELDDYERKALVKDLTVAFYTARGNAAAKS